MKLVEKMIMAVGQLAESSAKKMSEIDRWKATFNSIMKEEDDTMAVEDDKKLFEVVILNVYSRLGNWILIEK